MDMAFDGVDKTARFIIAARARAVAALDETSPKLTTLEKAMWLKLKRGERPCKEQGERLKKKCKFWAPTGQKVTGWAPESG